MAAQGQETWGEGDERVTARGYGASFWGDENVLKLTVMAVHSANILNTTESYTLDG